MVEDEAVDVEHLLLDEGGEILAEKGERVLGELPRPLPGIRREVVEGEAALGGRDGSQRSSRRRSKSQLHVVDGRLILMNAADSLTAKDSISRLHARREKTRDQRDGDSITRSR